MLDVHPPHVAAHGWRDFFIHIATITVGLLIALGLEASVEALHHHHQLAETREALAHEREENRARFAADTAYFRREAAELTNNLIVLEALRAHPQMRAAELPGVLRWSADHARMEDSAWRAAQQAGVTARMPQDELMRNAALYGFCERADKAHEDEADAFAEAVVYSTRDPDPTHLTAADLERQIELTRRLLSRHLRFGYLLENLAEQYPEFQPAPTHGELEQLLQLKSLDTDAAFDLARSRTRERLGK